MNTSKHHIATKSGSRLAILAAIALLPAAAAVAAPPVVNGIKLNTRVFNDFPTSLLVPTNTNTNPGNVTISEGGYVNDGVGGNGANRHDALFSIDGGATAVTRQINQGFTQSMIVNLADGSNAPRKEAGFRINAPVTGDALFIVNSDAGEIVAFGGGAAFFLFGNNSGGNGYTPGTPLFMAETYTPGLGGAAGTIQYYINRTAANGFGTGVETSGPLAFSNLELGPVNYQIGAYVQVSPANVATVGQLSTDFVNVSFTNLTATLTPEPTTLAGLAMGSLLLRRRRA